MADKILTLDDLLKMSQSERRQVIMNAHPFDADALDKTMYRGIDLSLPKIMNMILWKTFRKTFIRDEKSGDIRGWNVRMEQTGWDGAGVPQKKNGKQISFGHYRVRPAKGIKWPGGWVGEQYLDYHVAGNYWYDPGAPGFCPLVAVNKGRNDLLLGWEIVKFGPIWIPLPDFWALRLEGPLDIVEPVPCP
jgi:hypothetical protein